MKIVIIGAYNLAEGYGSCGKELMEMGFDVAFFPLFKMRALERSYTDIIHFCKGTLSDDIKKLYDSAINHTPTICPTICLWWQQALPISLSEFKHIKNSFSSKHVLLNWDPGYPSDSPKWNDVYKSTLNILPLLDQYITTNGDLCEALQDIVDKNKYSTDVQHFLPGFHSKITHPYKSDPEYTCDVNIICTNLYRNGLCDGGWGNGENYAPVNRAELVDELYKEKDITFHIYGPEWLGDDYPDAYKGRIPWENTNKVFSNSKLSLNISPVGNNCNAKDSKNIKMKYMSDRVPLILASNGTMISDCDYSGIFEPNHDYIYVKSVPDTIQKIKWLLLNDSFRKNITSSGHQNALKILPWINTLKNITSVWNSWK